MTYRTLTTRPRRALTPVLTLLGALALLGGCPVKGGGCPPCYVGDVMADSASPTASPSSALYVQHYDESSAEVVAVHVTLSNASGGSETHSYAGAEVSAIVSGSLTSIPDSELYEVEGEPPVKASVKVEFADGTKAGYHDIDIKSEKVTGKPRPVDEPRMEEDPKLPSGG